jgi:hypothetical protein
MILQRILTMSKIYKVPCGWEVYGYVEVSANSIDEAIKEVEADDYFPLPNRTIFGKIKGNELHRARFSYVDGTFEVDYDIAKEMNDE